MTLRNRITSPWPASIPEEDLIVLKRIIVLAAVAGMFAAFVPSSQAAGEEAFRIWSRNTDGDETRTKFISIPFAHIYRSTQVGETYDEGSLVDVTLLSLYAWERDGEYSAWSVLGNPFIKLLSSERDGESAGSLDLLTIGSGRRGGDVGSLYQRWHEGDRSGNRFLMFGTGRDSRVPE
jgi:hypothetical protein